MKKSFLVALCLNTVTMARSSAVSLRKQGGSTQVEKTTGAGGCFWCMVHHFDMPAGVHQIVSGYLGGTGSNPTYQDYAQKGYIEAVQITYDPQKYPIVGSLNSSGVTLTHLTHKGNLMIEVLSTDPQSSLIHLTKQTMLKKLRLHSRPQAASINLS